MEKEVKGPKRREKGGKGKENEKKEEEKRVRNKREGDEYDG